MNFLLVDDAKVLRIYLKNSINEFRHNPKDVFYEAGDGEDALKQLKIHEIDFIFLDLNMPLMNGIDVMKVIRKDEKYKDISVVILSGDGNKKTILDAINAGATDYLVKPPDKERIKEILNKIKE